VTAIELLRERSYSKRDYLAKLEYVNEPPFCKVVDIGKGCLLMSGHYGNWELLGTYVSNRGFPVDLLVKRQSNREVDDYLNSIRRSQGVGIIYTDSGSRALLQSIRNGRFVAILADQYGGADSVKVTFFGADVMVPTGPAVLLQKYGIPMIFGTAWRAKTGKHYLKTGLYTDFAGMSRTEIVQMYTKLLEEAVREHPEMWLWTHRRFKNITDYSGTVS
jgi:KDO2-lipid IV(A) lauroyltransferase